MFVSGPGEQIGLCGLTTDLPLEHNVVPLWSRCCSFCGIQLWAEGYYYPQPHLCPLPTLAVVLRVMISPLSFCKAQCFIIIMFWLQAAEEGNDYGFYYLLEFSTRVTEQLWLK